MQGIGVQVSDGSPDLREVAVGVEIVEVLIIHDMIGVVHIPDNLAFYRLTGVLPQQQFIFGGI